MIHLSDREILDAVREALEETAPKTTRDKQKPAEETVPKTSGTRATEKAGQQ